MAADRSGRAPLRSDLGAPAGAESGRCVEADRRQPGQARGAESRPALPGAATVRLLGAAPVARRAARADLRADGRVRRCDRASTLRAVRARTRRHRSCGRCRPDPTGVRERTGQAHQDAAEQTRGSAAAIAIEALDQLQSRQDSLLLFPNARGGYLDFRNFNRRHWKPVQKRVGIEPLRDLYDLRHTYATFALRAGVPVFALSRFMGTSIAMIDLHYGHLAVDSHEHAVSLLDALALERAVDAGWTSTRRTVKPRGDSVSRLRGRRSRRVVDARWTSRSEAVTASAVRRPD
jgi:hypothetical protein